MKSIGTPYTHLLYTISYTLHAYLTYTFLIQKHFQKILEKFILYLCDMEIFHLYPNDDLKEHFTDGRTCPCNPVTEVVEGGNILVIHNSWDGREVREKLIKDLEDNGIAN